MIAVVVSKWGARPLREPKGAEKLRTFVYILESANYPRTGKSNYSLCQQVGEGAVGVRRSVRAGPRNSASAASEGLAHGRGSC